MCALEPLANICVLLRPLLTHPGPTQQVLSGWSLRLSHSPSSTHNHAKKKKRGKPWPELTDVLVPILGSSQKPPLLTQQTQAGEKG